MQSSVLSNLHRCAWGLVSSGPGADRYLGRTNRRSRYPCRKDGVEYAAAKPVADSDWVDQFHDESLSRVVDQALAENRDLARLTRRIKLAEAEAAIAGAPARPQVGANFDGDRSQWDFIGFPGAAAIGGATGQEDVVFSSLTNTFNLNLNLRWELDIWAGSGRVGWRPENSSGRPVPITRRPSFRWPGRRPRHGSNWWRRKRSWSWRRRLWRCSGKTERAAEGDFREGVNRPGRDAGSELSLARVDVANARAELDGEGS